MFELVQLRILKELAKHRSVTGTAQALGYTPSAVSQQLAVMNRRAGVMLTRSAGRRVQLTEVGAAFATRASDILATLDIAERELLGSLGQARTLRVGTFGTAGSHYLVPALRRLQRTDPELIVHVAEHEPEDTFPLIDNGALDLALVYSFSDDPRPEVPGIVSRPVAVEPMVLICGSATGGAFTGGAASPALGDARWIGALRGSSDHELTRRLCATWGFQPGIVHQIDDYALTLDLVAAGAGVALVPAPVAAGRQDIRQLDTPGFSVTRQISVVHQRGYDARPEMKELLAELTDRASADLRAG